MKERDAVESYSTAEKEMQNMKHVWKRYLIVTAMTVVLGLSAGCGSAAEDTNNNQNNTQDENTPDGNENKNNTDGSQVPAGDNNGTSPDTNTDMNNDGTNGTNNNMNGATSGKGTVDENGNIIEDLGEDVGEGIKDVGDGIGEGVEDLTGGGSRDADQQNAQ